MMGSMIPSAALSAPVAAQGATVRLQRMLTEHFDFLWRTARRLGVHSGAVDDVVQQAYIVASSRLDDIEAGRERAFLVGTVIRLAANARRSVARSPVAVDAEAVEAARSGAPGPEELTERKRQRELLDRALAELPLELRAPFVLFEIEGLSGPEIARLLEIPSGTVASRLRRAREAFQTAVEALRALGPESRCP